MCILENKIKFMSIDKNATGYICPLVIFFWTPLSLMSMMLKIMTTTVTLEIYRIILDVKISLLTLVPLLI
jgi:hypothetical protein